MSNILDSPNTGSIIPPSINDSVPIMNYEATDYEASVVGFEKQHRLRDPMGYRAYRAKHCCKSFSCVAACCYGSHQVIQSGRLDGAWLTAFMRMQRSFKPTPLLLLMREKKRRFTYLIQLLLGLTFRPNQLRLRFLLPFPCFLLSHEPLQDLSLSDPARLFFRSFHA